MKAYALRQFHGRSKRVTISLPEELEMAVKSEIGEREFSAYAGEAIARLYRLDHLARLLEEMDAESGPVTEDVTREVASWWIVDENEE